MTKEPWEEWEDGKEEENNEEEEEKLVPISLIPYIKLTGTDGEEFIIAGDFIGAYWRKKNFDHTKVHCFGNLSFEVKETPKEISEKLGLE